MLGKFHRYVIVIAPLSLRICNGMEHFDTRSLDLVLWESGSVAGSAKCMERLLPSRYTNVFLRVSEAEMRARALPTTYAVDQTVV